MTKYIILILLCVIIVYYMYVSTNHKRDHLLEVFGATRYCGYLVISMASER